jgi:pilus assembly protein CpaB
MLLRFGLFILMAAGVAGLGTVAWISMHPAGRPVVAKAPPPAAVRVLTAARTLRPGVLLKPDDLSASALPSATVPEGARTDTPVARADLLGAMVRRTIAAGAVIVPAQVMRAGERGFLAAVLQPGKRAITVGVDAVSGTAGLIWPGDHVDLILTETIDDPKTPLGRRIAGETVLHNVRVIAIDQELMQGATAPSPDLVGPSQTRTVTLEVSPENAERVAVATRLGHLSLSVISADASNGPDAGSASSAANGDPITWAGDVSAALQSAKKAEPAAGTLRVYEGGAEGKEVHF